MKKTIFNASFEESQNYVTEKYIIASMKDSAKKIVIKRTAGVLIMNAFLLILAIFVRWVEHEAPIINPMLASKLNIVIYLFSLLTPLYYLIKILDYKNNTILNSYYFNQTMCIITFPFSISFYLFFVSISVGITGIPWLIFIYLILLVLFLINRYLSLNKKMVSALYHNKMTKNKLVDYYQKFEFFAKKYGSIIIILLFLFRVFFYSKSGTPSDYSFIQKVFIALSPLMGIFVIAFIFAMIESVMEGYYVKKYSEEYRIKYGYSKKDWYGSKSKMYKEELKNKQ